MTSDIQTAYMRFRWQSAYKQFFCAHIAYFALPSKSACGKLEAHGDVEKGSCNGKDIFKNSREEKNL